MAIETKSNNYTLKTILIIIALGVWALVLQNAGVVPTEFSTQDVRVVNSVDAYVQGSVRVDNTVDINISAINGHRNAFYDHNRLHPRQHYRIPVYTGQ